MTEQAITRHDLEAKIIAKAWQDEAFKQELINNPKATISREMGLVEVSQNLEFRVVEENADTFYLVLPMKPNIAVAGHELSEDQLEAVAGGGIPTFGNICQQTFNSLVKTLEGGIQKCIG